MQSSEYRTKSIVQKGKGGKLREVISRPNECLSTHWAIPHYYCSLGRYRLSFETVANPCSILVPDRFFLLRSLFVASYRARGYSEAHP